MFRLVASLALFSCVFFASVVHSAEGAKDAIDGPVAIALETIAWGRASAYPCRIPTLLVIRDHDDWERVWNLHHGREAAMNQLPDVDFKLFSVIALFSGQSTAVEGIEIARLEHLVDRVTVSALEIELGPGCTGPKTVMTPFHMVKVPALTKGIILSLEIEILARQCTR